MFVCLFRCYEIGDNIYVGITDDGHNTVDNTGNDSFVCFADERDVNSFQFGIANYC